jgi:uncharacterized protein (DUF1015 family)
MVVPILLFGDRAMSTSEPEEILLETVVPFRAWRYAPSAGDPALLVAPPYDVIGPELTSRLYARLAAGVFQAGFFMNPTGLDQIRRVALGGERMPQKATFFYPKLPTGLVFHELLE